MPGDADDVCRVCRTGRKPEYDLCYSCGQTTSQVGYPAEQIVPISYYTKPSPLRERMHDYKAAGDKVRGPEGRAVAAIIARYLKEHADALADKFGGWDAVVAVPSSRPSVRPALQIAIEHHFADVVGPFENCLTKGAGTTGRNRASECAFEADGNLKGRSLLLIDDTFTTGASLQSAHHALVAAGAEVPVPVVVTRKINPSEKWGTQAVWERQSREPFHFDDPPWWMA